MAQVSAYVKQVFQSKEMWVVIVAFIICFLLVYTLRRQAMDHAWKISIGAGAVANVIPDRNRRYCFGSTYFLYFSDR